jgi:hypothetical protein
LFVLVAWLIGRSVVWLVCTRERMYPILMTNVNKSFTCFVQSVQSDTAHMAVTYRAQSVDLFCGSMNTFIVGLREITNCGFVDSIIDRNYPSAPPWTFCVRSNEIN